MFNLATNKHASRIVVGRGLTACANESGGLNLRDGNDTSPLLDSTDSKQMIKNLIASLRYYPFDFLSFTCNQQLYFGTKPIKEWSDNTECQTCSPNYDLLNDDEKNEMKNSLEQASSGLLLRAWNKSYRTFFRLH